ncbi:TPA: hypothetical protein QDA82_000671 [Burkholderia vietnamiensis]|nr:hypothetical protein [Burkholderia vietnamiensis]
MTNRTNQKREPFYGMPPEARAELAAKVQQHYREGLALIAAFINQPDDEEGGRVVVETDRDFLDRYGYPPEWDEEEPQPRAHPTSGTVIEAMLRDTACSSDEMDAGLFDHMRADGID